jgi:hypothetical protein
MNLTREWIDKATVVTNPTEVPMLKTMLSIAALALALVVQFSAAHARGTLGPGYPSPPGNEHPICCAHHGGAGGQPSPPPPNLPPPPPPPLPQLSVPCCAPRAFPPTFHGPGFPGPVVPAPRHTF